MLGREGIEAELERIESQIDSQNIVVKQLIPGSPTHASNDGHGTISLRYLDANNISENEIEEHLSTLVHEFYHTVSKTPNEEKVTFLEEGYVTYITAQSIRYALNDQMPSINGIKEEDLSKLLEKQDLMNGYEESAEFVRSFDLLMKRYGIDSTIEFLLDENSPNILEKIASDIDEKYGKLLIRQRSKNVNSKMFEDEKKFFENVFSETPIQDFSETTIEMNKLLQDWLLEKDITYIDENIRRLLLKFNAPDFHKKEFFSELSVVSPEELRKKIDEELPTEHFDYQLYDDIIAVTEQFFEVKRHFDSADKKVKAGYFGSLDFYALQICYDLAVKGITDPSDEQLKKYCERLSTEANIDKMVFARIQNYKECVMERQQSGANIIDILSEKMGDNVEIVTKANEIKSTTTKDNFWESVEQLADVVKKDNEERHNDYSKVLYLTGLDMCSKYFINDTQEVYGVKEYNEFVAKMSGVFEGLGSGEYLKNVGLTPEKMFFTAVPKNIDADSQNFAEQTMEMLKIINTQKPNLGSKTNDLNGFCFNLYETNRVLKESRRQRKVFRIYERIYGSIYIYARIRSYTYRT